MCSAFWEIVDHGIACIHNSFLRRLTEISPPKSLVYPGAVLRRSFWALFSIIIGVGGFQSKQFPLRNQIWETPLPPLLFFFTPGEDAWYENAQQWLREEERLSNPCYAVLLSVWCSRPSGKWEQQWVPSAPTAPWWESHQPRCTKEPGQQPLGKQPNASPWGWGDIDSIWKWHSSRPELWLCFFISS